MRKDKKEKTKRIWLGESFIALSLVVGALAVFAGMFWLILETNERTIFASIGFSLSIIISWLIVVVSGSENIAFLKVFEDKLVLHYVFSKRTIEYYKENIIMRYAIHDRITRRYPYRYPCFVIGIWMGSTFRYTKNKLIYDNYFLLLLDRKKLNAILSWYDDEIQLPEEEEINALRNKKVKKFYEIIKLHNERISKQQKAK